LKDVEDEDKKQKDDLDKLLKEKAYSKTTEKAIDKALKEEELAK